MGLKWVRFVASPIRRKCLNRKAFRSILACKNGFVWYFSTTTLFGIFLLRRSSPPSGPGELASFHNITHSRPATIGFVPHPYFPRSPAPSPPSPIPNPQPPEPHQSPPRAPPLAPH